MKKTFTAKVKYIFRGRGLPLAHDEELRQALIELLSFKVEPNQPTDEDLVSKQFLHWRT